jgi:hypothetical protein
MEERDIERGKKVDDAELSLWKEISLFIPDSAYAALHTTR